MSTSVHTLPRSSLLPNREYGGFLGILLVGLLVLSTVDDTGVATLGRGLALAGIAVLTVLNVGAAIGVYIGAALLFSTHHFAGQGSWAERPDNYALLILLLYLTLGRGFGQSAGRLGWTAAAAALLIFTSVAHLFTIVGFSMFELTWFMRMFGFPFVILVLVRRAALSSREIRAMFLVVAVITVFAALVTLLEALRWYAIILPPWVGNPLINPVYGEDRLGGIAMQAEWNALILSLGFCVLLLRLDYERPVGRVPWIVGGAFCLAAIFLTFTRGAWLGLVLAGIPLFWQSSAGRGALRRRVLFAFGALGFLALAFFGPSEALQSRTTDVGTVYFRFNVWIGGLRMLVEHPLFGVGYAQFGPSVIPYLGAFGSIPESPGLNEVGTIAHNTLLSVAAELGLIGLGLYLFVCAGVFRAAWRTAGEVFGPRGQSWVAGFTIVYHVNIQFITAHELTPNMFYFALMGAVAGMKVVRSGVSSPAATPGNRF